MPNANQHSSATREGGLRAMTVNGPSKADPVNAALYNSSPSVRNSSHICSRVRLYQPGVEPFRKARTVDAFPTRVGGPTFTAQPVPRERASATETTKAGRERGKGM